MEINVSPISYTLSLGEILSADVVRDSKHLYVLGEIEDLERFDRKTFFGKTEYSVLKTTTLAVEGYRVLEKMDQIYDGNLQTLYYNKKIGDWVFISFEGENRKQFYSVNLKLAPVGDMTEKQIASFRNSNGKVVVSIGANVRYLQNTTLALLPLVYCYRSIMGNNEFSGARAKITKDLVGIVDGYFLAKNFDTSGKEAVIVSRDYELIADALGLIFMIAPEKKKLKTTKLMKFMDSTVTSSSTGDMSDDEVDKVLEEKVIEGKVLEEKAFEDEVSRFINAQTNENKKLYTMAEIYNLPDDDREYIGVFRGKEISELFDKHGRDLGCLLDSFIYSKGKIIATVKQPRTEEEREIILAELETCIKDTFGKEVVMQTLGEKADVKM